MKAYLSKFLVDYTSWPDMWILFVHSIKLFRLFSGPLGSKWAREIRIMHYVLVDLGVSAIWHLEISWVAWGLTHFRWYEPYLMYLGYVDLWYELESTYWWGHLTCGKLNRCGEFNEINLLMIRKNWDSNLESAMDANKIWRDLKFQKRKGSEIKEKNYY